MKKKLFKDNSSFKEKALNLLNKEGFYVAVFLGITLVATMLIYSVNDNGSSQDIAQEQPTEENVTLEPETENVSTAIEEEKEEPTQEQKEEPEKPAGETPAETTTKPEEAPASQPEKTNPGTGLKDMVSPVGAKEVVMAFSMGGQPVFSQTLQEFTSEHTGIDLQADEGQEVKAALDGKVTKIYNDGKLGQTIIIQHSNNIETRYSNLNEKVSVTLNQSVSAGDTIGKVGKTAVFESEEGDHLHFEVWQNGKCIDPSEYL